MEGFRVIILPLYFSSVLFGCVDGKWHYHSTRHSHVSPYHSPSRPPHPSPRPSPSESPSYAPRPGHACSSKASYHCAFDVRTFGAVGDSVTDDTNAFESAWRAACQVASATMFVPSNHTFVVNPVIFSGPCRPGLVFQVDGMITPPDGPDSWPEGSSKRKWLSFYKVNSLTLQGKGTIDGRGEKWWNLPCKPHRGANGTTLSGPCDSPVAIWFFGSSSLILRGLKIINSPQFHVRFDSCSSVLVDALVISSPALSPNTDGIHVENTKSVEIYNSVISNGDDCVSIGAGSSNVKIQNVTCGPSHGISIGSLGNQNSHACVSDITVSDTIIKHSDNGVRIKTWQGGSGSVSGVTFKNLVMDTVRNPIIINQYYCLSLSCANQTSGVLISDITYSGIKGTYDIRSPAIHFACSDSAPCTNLTLMEIELLPSQGQIFRDPFCWNAYGLSQTLTIPPVACLQEGLPQGYVTSETDRCR